MVASDRRFRLENGVVNIPFGVKCVLYCCMQYIESGIQKETGTTLFGMGTLFLRVLDVVGNGVQTAFIWKCVLIIQLSVLEYDDDTVSADYIYQ